jgi:molybdate transport system regulatory protein
MHRMHDTENTAPPPGHGRLFPVADSERCLDSKQLHDFEQAFRRWAESSRRPDHRNSRERILLIFLLIRYTGARLNEVLSLDIAQDIDFQKNIVRFGKRQSGKDFNTREVQIPETISADIRVMTTEAEQRWPGGSMLRIDPAHVRRKFYQQAMAIGIASGMGTPETIRKSRAVELMRSDMPLPVIQRILGHATPNRAASYVEFSDTEISQVAKYFADRENHRQTSARNSFFGKINTIEKGDIQTIVEVVSVSGNIITSIITSNSLGRIGLKPGMLIKAEVKAPWIQLSKDRQAPTCSAENTFQGTVCRITKNRITAEIVVRLLDGTELCAIITEKSRRRLDIRNQDLLWAFFDASAVVLHLD